RERRQPCRREDLAANTPARMPALPGLAKMSCLQSRRLDFGGESGQKQEQRDCVASQLLRRMARAIRRRAALARGYGFPAGTSAPGHLAAPALAARSAQNIGWTGSTRASSGLS